MLKKYFYQDDFRLNLIIKNITGSFVLKFGIIVINMILVPLTLHYLNAFDYGIWLTLSSILLWINYFDIGLCNGLRNKLAEALAKNDTRSGQIYVSTTFFILLGIILFFFTMFFMFQYWIDWSKLFNIPILNGIELRKIILIIFLLVSLTSVFRVVGIIYISLQLPVINDIISIVGSFLSLVGIFMLTKFVKANLFNVALVYCISPFFVILVSFFYTFRVKYPFLCPSFKSIKLNHTKELMGLSFTFFFLQIAGMLLFTSANLLISNLFGPSEVTLYNIAYKYFSLVSYIFGIIIAPFWAAITEAYFKKDKIWITKSFKKLKIVWLIMFLITLIMLFLSNFAFKIWLGGDVKIPFSLSLLFTVYISITNYNSILASILNGMSKLRIQFYCALVVIVLFFPIAHFLGRYYKTNGILMTICITLLVSTVFQSIQLYKIINNKSTGIWNK
jgi:O-antigen/teichoic acid export membrane protein